MRSFILIWSGQLVSLIGSGLTAFALGVWVYQRTESVTQFALIALCTELPGIVISPIAGVLVDRWNRRWSMILSDAGAALMTGAIAVLFFTHQLQVWHIYLATAISSLFVAFQWPAYSAAITLLVPKEQLGRASGLFQLGEAGAQLISPLLGGVLLGLIQIQGIILLDFTTFLLGLTTLFIVRVPNTKITNPTEIEESNLLQQATYGWRYISARPGLMGLLIFSAADNFLVGVVSVLVTPLALSFTSPTILGIIMSVGGIGMVAGSLVMASWGGPQRLMNGVFAFNLLGGLSILAAGVHPSVPLLALCSFLFFFNLPIINGCEQVIWQKKVAVDVQGRVFATRRMFSWASLPIAYLLAGPLADRVFEPLMKANGLLTSTVGRIIGVGAGRGIGLMFIIMGTLTILATLLAYQFPRLRLVESELPDVISD